MILFHPCSALIYGVHGVMNHTLLRMVILHWIKIGDVNTGKSISMMMIMSALTLASFSVSDAVNFIITNGNASTPRTHFTILLIVLYQLFLLLLLLLHVKWIPSPLGDDGLHLHIK